MLQIEHIVFLMTWSILKTFNPDLLKIDKKSYKKLIFITLDTSQ